ncbi:hypothetical protein [Fluviicola sp.]|uniref:hypothetical protein n=1 Tax=Fluviicola sp. TaxID=1917219 RepID=UPI0031E31E89
MYLQTKEEIKQHLGSKSLFKKLPKTDPVLKYARGVQEPAFDQQLQRSESTLSIERYPNGILISDLKKEFRIGLPFSDIKSFEINREESGNYELIFKMRKPALIALSFKRKDRVQIISFVKLLPLKDAEDPRPQEAAHEEILKLKEAFASDYFTDRTFNQELKSLAKKNVPLEITKQYIQHGDTTISTSSATGYASSIEELTTHGISRFEYRINIYHTGGHHTISFTSASMFLKEGKYTPVIHQIGLVLFDVISRPIITKWFDKFAKGESINYKEFSVSRQGITLKRKEAEILIHWDEIIAQNVGMFRWPYSNTVFQQIDGTYDYRGNMLLNLINWLQSDPERLISLMGRSYSVL